MPLIWHKRHALLLAGQLPESAADARMVVEALKELLDTFLAEAGPQVAEAASNVLPFATG